MGHLDEDPGDVASYEFGSRRSDNGVRGRYGKDLNTAGRTNPVRITLEDRWADWH